MKIGQLIIIFWLWTKPLFELTKIPGSICLHVVVSVMSVTLWEVPWGMANVIWLSCDYHAPGCLSFTFSFPIKFWCMGMFWWIQPNKHRSAVCSCHANYNHSEGYGRQGNADLSKRQSLLKLLLQSKYDRIWFYFLWKLIANWNMTVLHIYTGI